MIKEEVNNSFYIEEDKEENIKKDNFLIDEDIFNNEYINKLNNIQQKIQNMSKHNQIEVLKILKGNKNIVLSENKYGIFVNLTELDKNIIEKLQLYIKYVDTQELTLSQFENEKEKIKKDFF